MEVPANSLMVFFVENPRKMDELGVPRFRKPPYIYIHTYIHIYPDISLGQYFLWVLMYGIMLDPDWSD